MSTLYMHTSTQIVGIGKSYVVICCFSVIILAVLVGHIASSCWVRVVVGQVHIGSSLRGVHWPHIGHGLLLS